MSDSCNKLEGMDTLNGTGVVVTRLIQECKEHFDETYNEVAVRRAFNLACKLKLLDLQTCALSLLTSFVTHLFSMALKLEIRSSIEKSKLYTDFGKLYLKQYIAKHSLLLFRRYA